ncbi:hypothetical protein RJ55_01196 [Drechmeria coniospora]|nr:hypothetical protein RJ55_01196 [Drechmeria coniospora]
MKLPQRASWTRHFVSLAVVLCLAGVVQASNDCAPSVWQPGQFTDMKFKRQAAATTSSLNTGTGTVSPSSVAVTSIPVPVSMSPLLSGGNVTTGKINCRYTTNTKGMDINYYTCTALANRYHISVEKFFQLNPTVHANCGNIQADTDYCVAGFIEPLRATKGLCGPPNGNATCRGTEFQCCNAKTFTCGNSLEDCADGTCYEGACAGDSVFTTNGECGRQHGYKQCAGVWGDCCNAEGKCGTGEAFCAYGKCQLGNCTLMAQPQKVPVGGATPDGTCGGTKQYKCNAAYGKCCNKDGRCGRRSEDCGTGCQPLFGDCTIRHTSFSSTTTTTTTTKVSTPSSTLISSKTPTTKTPTLSALPSCGQTCFNNMLGQYSQLGCASPDADCLCGKVDFLNGIRDCSNGACGTDIGSAVIAFGKAYCSSAPATHTPTVPSIDSLPLCGQTCFNNMLAQYSQLGCASPDAACLCKKADFGYGLRDCSNRACGESVASTVIAYGRSWCASATAPARA